MAQFEPIKAELEQAKAQLLFVAAERLEGMFKPARFLQKHPVTFPFLLDEDRAVIKAYGLYHRLGKDAVNIAHPATLVIDSSGTVRYIYRGDNQADRAPTEKILEAVRKLPMGPSPKANT
jgi:peroxiredoxin